MLNSDTNVCMVQMPISKNYHILYRHKENKFGFEVIMTPITEEEENMLDNIENKEAVIVRENRTFNIRNYQIYCYGEVDFYSENDLKIIDDFNFLNHLGGVGVRFPSNYNYATHTANHPMYTETWSPSLLAKYAHASLNYPSRILLFKQ